MRAARKGRPSLRLTSTKIGILLLAGTLVMFGVLFSKDRISTTMMSGDTVEVHFERAYKLRPHISEVKVAFVPVGKVTAVERDENGGALVTLKVDRDALDALGSAPSATIRPTTLLGGSYFVDLEAGGDPGAFSAADIPVDRTEVAVELDKVARALQPDALEGLRGSVRHLDDTLDPQGTRALKRLLAAAPDTLRPAAVVLDAARGEDPRRDLTRLVSGLESTARTLTTREAALDRILVNLDRTTQVLGGRSTEIRDTLSALPGSLDSTRGGLARLDTTLDILRDVSDDTRPVAAELTMTLAEVDPALREARPLVRDLRFLVRDAQPLVDGLVPSASTATRVLNDVRGPVLERLNGSFMDWLYAKYDGKGPYSMTHSEKTMYEEITYTFTDLTRASSMMDKNGHGVGFQPGIGSGSIGGLPISVEQMFKSLTYVLYSQDPRNTLPPLDSNGGGNNLEDLLGSLTGGGR